MAAPAGDEAIDRGDGFAAGGTLPRPDEIAWPSEARRLWLLAEFAILFIGTPLAMRTAVFDYRVPLFYALPPVLAGFIAFLFFDPGFSLQRELRRGISLATLKSVLAIFITGSVIVSVRLRSHPIPQLDCCRRNVRHGLAVRLAL
jgi:hypothetical protein